MPLPAKSLPDRKLVEPLFRAVKYVFETNLIRRTQMVDVLTFEEVSAIFRKDENDFTFSAVKCSGGYSCTIAIASPSGLNFIYARDFLDVDDSMLQLGAEIPVYRDAAGEINNMVAGTFRNLLAKTGVNCSLTPPMILDRSASLLKPLSNANTAVIARFDIENFRAIVFLWT